MGGAKKPLTAWSEEELEDELRQRILEAATTITVQGIPLKEMQHGVQNVPVVGTDDHNSRAVQEIPSDRDGTP
jgi:predicted Ser/Thr protein kinase